MLTHLRPAVVLVVVLTALTGLAYPLAMTGISAALFPDQASGRLISGKDGSVVGSELIGQNFTSDRYFHGRPSATTGSDPGDPSKTVAQPYNAVNSMGSNLGPTNQALIDRVKDDLAKLKSENPNAPVPIELVTTSASGLDPHISPEAARFQVPRVAKARGIAADQLDSLIQKRTEERLLGLFGERRVNVLLLNLDLDALSKS
jgi:potassium-transporting ATPase KdpC subunit